MNSDGSYDFYKKLDIPDERRLIEIKIRSVMA